jgi:hypothetical protein
MFQKFSICKAPTNLQLFSQISKEDKIWRMDVPEQSEQKVFVRPHFKQWLTVLVYHLSFHLVRGLISTGSQSRMGKKGDPISKITSAKGLDQVVKCVPRKCKALSSKLSSALILQKRIFIF